ncbi:hypothetical protein L228DRAFT_268661 [Xylona heveae TC161]|uniref:Uncharacterized protein n=1 Tax=Xylona heveae (strain CBS 132557 / TC161) TaxID=1328760 RepID=A0A165GH27_XYLHT|nr:hypothetical protein L228DRAFT_268661 [Xylona heveae TC161]KZF22176.1 hypothetical protein L228DRAFT_268661 [Xylona heveae TC161]
MADLTLATPAAPSSAEPNMNDIHGDVAYDGLMLDEDDPRRVHENPVNKMVSGPYFRKLTTPGGSVYGGVLKEGTKHYDKILAELQDQYGDITNRGVNEAAVEELLRYAVSGLTACKENDDRVEEDIKELVAQREVELKVEEKSRAQRAAKQAKKEENGLPRSINEAPQMKPVEEDIQDEQALLSRKRKEREFEDGETDESKSKVRAIDGQENGIHSRSSPQPSPKNDTLRAPLEKGRFDDAMDETEG